MAFSLHHLVREPKIKLDQNPLLLLLHGYGSNEEDLFSFASELPDEYYVISARAPYDLMYGSYAWYAINFDADENSYLRYKEQERKNERTAQDNAVHVGLANEIGYPHTGRVDFLDNQVNPTIGTVRARAVLSNADRIFTPGLFARVQFVSGQKAQALLIDDKAILTDQDRKYVYAVDTDGKAQRKDVVVGGLVDGLRVVRSGLTPEDRIVVVGLQKIFYPGMPVTPAEVSMDKPSAPGAPAAMAEK